MAGGLPCDGWNPATGTCNGWSGYSQEIRDYATALSTLVLWAATGRRYGQCLVTVRPCGPVDPMLYRTYPVQDGNYWTLFGVQGGVIGPVAFGGCCAGSCVCSPSEVLLPGPVSEVTEVQIDGVVVNTDGYRLDGDRLVRVGGSAWPAQQDLSAAAGEENTWQVTYRRGRVVPVVLQNAAGLFACEVAKARSGGSCALPARITSVSRQGVDVQLLSVEDFLDKGLTGYEQVDMVIRALNPSGLHAAPRVLSLDVPQMR